jgi:hypothetical protein
VRGCPDYLRTKGSQKERKHLLQLKRDTEIALASARRYAADNRVEIVQTWVKHHQETLAGLEAALAVDELFDAPDGKLIRPARGEHNGTEE